MNLEHRKIDLECEYISMLGASIYSPHWVEHNKKAVEYHNKHCRTSLVNDSVYGCAQGHKRDIKKFKRYGLYGDCEVYWYRCGCVEVIHTPIPRRYWFTPKQYKIRFELVNTLISRNRSLNRML